MCGLLDLQLSPQPVITPVPYFVLPSEAGLPFGKGSYEWLSVETHYNNPTATPGESDPGRVL